jgi:cytochrome c oxidase cbb3-type subunit 3
MGARIEQRQVDYESEFGETRRGLLRQPLAALAESDVAMNSAWHVFNNHCSSCHGRDAAGQAKAFPDLTDAAWQWGSDESQVIESIRSGRHAAMPGWSTVVGQEGVEQLADYVLGLSGSATAPTFNATAAGALFQQFCAACHGLTGEGNPLLGAPALNDGSWNYGSARADVIESIAIGRNGIMPAFGERLDATQIRLLAAWLKAGAQGR